MTRDVWAGWDVLMVWLFFSCVFIGYDPDGSIWRDRYAKLLSYEKIVENPVLLEKVLSRYHTIREDLELLENGFKLRDAITGKEVQCIAVHQLYDNYNLREFYVGSSVKQ